MTDLNLTYFICDNLLYSCFITLKLIIYHLTNYSCFKLQNDYTCEVLVYKKEPSSIQESLQFLLGLEKFVDCLYNPGVSDMVLTCK